MLAYPEYLKNPGRHGTEGHSPERPSFIRRGVRTRTDDRVDTGKGHPGGAFSRTAISAQTTSNDSAIPP